MKKNISQEAYIARLQQLAETKKPANKNIQFGLGTLIDYKRAADGVAYGIIKEQHLYYIKKGGLKQDPNVSDFAYIGGLGNITDYQYHKLSEADKQRNMLLKVINESVTTKVSKTGSKRKLNEDKAGDEIEQAASKVGDLDAATDAAEVPAEPPVDLSGGDLPSAPDGGSEDVPAPDMGAEEPAPDGGEPAPDMGGEPGMGGGEEPALEGGDETEPAPEGDETAPEGTEGGAGLGLEDQKSLTVQEIEKSIGKLTEKIRKTDLEPEQDKSYLKSFIQAFRPKLKDLEIEDRKDIADLILKVVPDEEIEDLGSTVPQGDDETSPAEQGVEEGEMCAECGGFKQYAESRGYGDVNSLMECGEEELGNVISGYGNAHNDGMNDGDLGTVGLLIKVVNPEMLGSLKNDYGHDDYAKELEPHVNSMDESTQEENVAKLNELWGGLGSLAKGAMGGIKKGAQAVGGAVQKGAQAVGGAVQKGAQAVAGAAEKGMEKVGQAGQAIKQQYYKGEINPAVKKVEADAANLGKQIANLNSTLTKAGQQPVNVQSILQTITNQLGRGGTASIGSKLQMAAEGVVDPGNVEVQPNMLKEDEEPEVGETPEHEAGETPEEEKAEHEPGGEEYEGEENAEEKPFFGPGAQTLGAGIVKPDGAPTTGVDINISPDKTVNISMNEAKQKLIKQIAEGVNAYLNEMTIKTGTPKGKGKPFVNVAPKTKKINEEDKPSAGLSKEKKGDVVKAAKKGEDIGKPGKGFEKVADKAAKEYGSKEKGEKVAAAAMWKNVKRESEEPKRVMSESEQKLRKYIRTRIEENAGLKKPILTESKKSETLKKLDTLIDEQYKLYGRLNENMWDSMKSAAGNVAGKMKRQFQTNAQEFENLDPNNEKEIELAFNSVMKDALRNPNKQKWAMTMTPQEKYGVLKQGYETDKLATPGFGLQVGRQGNVYKYLPLKLANPFAGGGTGGKMQFGGSTGT